MSWQQIKVQHNCKLKPLRIRSNNLDQMDVKYTRLHPDADFEKGIVKIMRGEASLLTEQEKIDCDHLKIFDREENIESKEDNDSEEVDDNCKGSIIDAYFKNKEKESIQSQPIDDGYGNCNFIYSSSA